MSATITVNVNRWLAHFGLLADVTIYEVHTDRVFAITNWRLVNHIVANKWDISDPPGHGGSKFSAREPGGVRTALQICWHDGSHVEIDFDYASPQGGFKSFFIHVGEILWNFLAGATTNQDKIFRGLTKRGIP